jgi:hypothetical protein
VARAGRAGRGSSRRAKPPDSVERAADELYGLPLQDFVTTRNARAKELRGAGLREEAEAVRKLQKPTLPSWVVNQLARRRELDVRRLAKAGEGLQKESTDAAAFAEARREEAEVLRRLLRAARDLLEGEGRPPSGTTLERVGTNLRAAAVSDDRRDALLRGQLVEDLEPAGFEALARSVAAARPERETRPSAAARSRTAQQLKAARRRAEQAEAEAESLERTVAQAEDELANAKRAARDAGRRLETARSKAERARRQADRAAATLRDLEAD